MASSLVWQAAAWGDEWTNLATAVTVTEGRLCAGELAADGTGTDILCDTDHPSIDSSGNIMVTGELSATTLNATQLCDEDGANCTDLSGGISGASSLVDLTDTNVSTPSDMAILQWSSGSSKWVAGAPVSGCSAGSTDIMPTMSGSTTSGYTVTASSEESGHPGWDVFDGSTGINNKWAMTGTSAILTIQLATSQVLAKYSIISVNESGQTNRTPKDWTFQGSLDGSTWVTLDSQASETGWSVNETRTYQFSNTIAYTYYRLNVTDNNGGSLMAIGEMELFELSCSGADDLGDHTATQNIQLSGFDITGADIASVTSVYATQLCDEDGANCTDLSGGLGTASALTDLTDVSATGAATGSILRYDGTSWTSVADLSTALSTTTMEVGFPDAIRCGHGSGDWIYINGGVGTGHGNYMYYPSWTTSSSYDLVISSSTGLITAQPTTATTGCTIGTSVADLYANGRAFNFLGNNGAQISLTEVADVSATNPTEGQLLSYDASENEWVAKDVISETIILNSADDNPCVVTSGVRKLSFNPTTGRLRVCRP